MIFHIQDNGHYFLLRQHFYELNDVKCSICEYPTSGFNPRYYNDGPICEVRKMHDITILPIPVYPGEAAAKAANSRLPY